MKNENIIIKEINQEEALRYMGYRGTSPDSRMRELIRQCEGELLEVIHPRYCYKVFDLEWSETEVKLNNASLLLKGESIREHLKGCQKAVILCATLSGEADRLIRSAKLQGMTKALIIDALSNAAIEQVCDEAEKIIMRGFPEYTHTWRFGVGYGDFPLSTQQALLETLDAGKRIGVCALDSAMLTPGKSVTCVLGLSKTEESDIQNISSERKTCSVCNMRSSCTYRKTGQTCRQA